MRIVELRNFYKDQVITIIGRKVAHAKFVYLWLYFVIVTCNALLWLTCGHLCHSFAWLILRLKHIYGKFFFSFFTKVPQNYKLLIFILNCITFVKKSTNIILVVWTVWNILNNNTIVPMTFIWTHTIAERRRRHK
jgi:hypothetical protein